jgi:hypothetical protein
MVTGRSDTRFRTSPVDHGANHSKTGADAEMILDYANFILACGGACRGPMSEYVIRHFRFGSCVDDARIARRI